MIASQPAPSSNTHSRFEQARIQQLISPYSPDSPPRLPLDFGDYLSLIWRADQAANHLNQSGRLRYYRACADALAAALDLPPTLTRLVATAPPGEVYPHLSNLPFRGGKRSVDVHDRCSAITQLLQLREETLRIGTVQESWMGSFPGSGIQDNELRERVFAVLFTALQGQFGNFGRLLLVVDIVLGDLLIGMGSAASSAEVLLTDLIDGYDYPDPNDARVRREFA